MKLHQRGIDLLLNVQDAILYLDKLSAQDIRALLTETEVVLGSLLARDVPQQDDPTG